MLRKKIVFLCSGNGGNLKFIDSYLNQFDNSKLKIAGIITDRECGALNYAIKNELPNKKIVYSQSNNQNLKMLLLEINPDLVITNFHKIIDEEIVRLFNKKLINLHYSLLPAFGGLIGVKPIMEALNKKSKYIGTTVHFVDPIVDNGEIISQSVMPLIDTYTAEKVIELIFRQGCINLLNAIYYTLNLQEIMLVPEHDDKYAFNPKICINIKNISDDFWNKVKNI
jgi:phosphoribosylglycinamide formyltransferase-1